MTKRGATVIFKWDNKGLAGIEIFCAVFALVQNTSFRFFAVKQQNGTIREVLVDKTINY